MLGGKSGDIFIELEPIPRPFYNAGDTVRGKVVLDVYSQSLTFKDIQVKVRCDEWSAVAFDDDQKQAMVEMREARHAKRVARRQRGGHARKSDNEAYTTSRPSAASEHQRHVDLVATLVSANGKTLYERGRHEFDFAIELPVSVALVPAHSPVPTRNGLKVGVEWSVKAVAHRTGHLKSSLRAVTDIPVHPTPKILSRPDLSRRTELRGLKQVGSSKKQSSGSVFGLGPDAKLDNNAQVLVVKFGYPDAGIPQGPLKPNFTLVLAAASGAVSVSGISVYLVQRCLASIHKKLEMKDAYKNLFPLGKVKTQLKIEDGAKDLTDLVADFALEDVFASPFASNFTTVSYELRLEVEVVTPEKGKPEALVFEVPVNLLGPGLCWPEKSNEKVFRAEAHQASPEIDENAFESDSSAPRESDYGLPSYEEALPMSNTRVIDEVTFTAAKSRVAN